MLFDWKVWNFVFYALIKLPIIILQGEELQVVPLTKCGRDILVIVNTEIFLSKYRFNDALRIMFVHLLAAVDNALDGKIIMNANEHGVLKIPKLQIFWFDGCTKKWAIKRFSFPTCENFDNKGTCTSAWSQQWSWLSSFCQYSPFYP